MTAELPLTKGYVAIIDEADLPLVGRWKWSALVTSSTVYAKRNDRGRIVLLHRVLMGAEGWNARVDHRDGNGLNNCRSNLRLCTQAQNTANQRPQRNKSPEWSRFKGVEKTNVEEYCVSEGWVRVAVGATKDRRGNPLTLKMQGPVEPYFRDAEEPSGLDG